MGYLVDTTTAGLPGRDRGARRGLRTRRASRWAPAARSRSSRCSPQTFPGIAVLIWGAGDERSDYPLRERERRPRGPRADGARRSPVPAQPRRLSAGSGTVRAPRSACQVDVSREARTEVRATSAPRGQAAPQVEVSTPPRRTWRSSRSLSRRPSWSRRSSCGSRPWCASSSTTPARPRWTRPAASGWPRSTNAPSSELGESISQDLKEELDRARATRSRASRRESEIRIAQAQLVGWLEGLFHGIQAAMFAQQAAARAAVRGAPAARPPRRPAPEEPSAQPGPPTRGQYL